MVVEDIRVGREYYIYIRLGWTFSPLFLTLIRFGKRRLWKVRAEEKGVRGEGRARKLKA